MKITVGRPPNAKFVTVFMPPERLGNLLNPKEIEGLEQVLARTKEIARLTGALAASLDGTLGANIVSAAVDKEGVLVVKATSSAWAARLRFEESRLLDAAREAGVPAARIAVRVGRPGRDREAGS